jgi:anti-sigma-K factor RskA
MLRDRSEAEEVLQETYAPVLRRAKSQSVAASYLPGFMNTSIEDGNFDLRYAEYVLGVLDADARAEVARDVRASEETAIAVALWEPRLLPLYEEIVPHAAPAYVWTRIRAELHLDAPVRRGGSAVRPGLWDGLRLRHWLGLGASTLAIVASLVLVQLFSRHGAVPVAPAISYIASTLTQTDGWVGWTAAMDLQQARMIVVPAAPQALESEGAPELWLIPPGEKPIAVGIAVNGPITLKLDRALLATATPAVSAEPTGGSPTGQPTGPVIAQGAFGAAADSEGAHVAVLRTIGAGREAA